jgi:hypothetical protein
VGEEEREEGERERERERDRTRARERESETERDMNKDTLKSSAKHHDLGWAYLQPNRLTLTCLRPSLIFCYHWMMLCFINHGVRVRASATERARERARARERETERGVARA